MSTTTDHVEHAAADHADAAHDAHEHKPDSFYIKVALALGLITGAEVYASYANWLGSAFVPLLLIMMVIKFIMVVSLFMHLKFDNKIFSWLFYTGLVLAVLVYCAFLACFQFFSSN